MSRSPPVVGIPAGNPYAAAPVPLIWQPATTMPVIGVVPILNPALRLQWLRRQAYWQALQQQTHWQWMQRQAHDWKERSSLDYDPSKEKEEKNLSSSKMSESANPKKPPPNDNRRWKSNFELLSAFQRQHGHCRIPAAGATGTTSPWPIAQQKLLKWVSDQQKQYRRVMTGKGKTAPALTRERVALLNSIGFEWELPNIKRNVGISSIWNEKFELLQAFQRENGHCRVPQKHEALGKWVNNQRWAKKRFDQRHSDSRGITQDHIDKLDSIGFEWTVRDDRSTSWNDKFELLHAFQREHGHCRVPQRHGTLGEWVHSNRRAKKRFDQGHGSSSGITLTQERIDKLDSIGFDWKLRRGKKGTEQFDTADRNARSSISSEDMSVVS